MKDCRDSDSEGQILPQTPLSWPEIFAMLDEAGFDEEFLADREQGEHNREIDLGE